MFAISHTLVHSARRRDKSSRILFRMPCVQKKHKITTVFEHLSSSLRDFRSQLLKRMGKIYAFVARIARNVVISQNIERRREYLKTFPFYCTRDKKSHIKTNAICLRHSGRTLSHRAVRQVASSFHQMISQSLD